jgi:hypothetical protein
VAPTAPQPVTTRKEWCGPATTGPGLCGRRCPHVGGRRRIHTKGGLLAGACSGREPRGAAIALGKSLNSRVGPVGDRVSSGPIVTGRSGPGSTARGPFSATRGAPFSQSMVGDGRRRTRNAGHRIKDTRRPVWLYPPRLDLPI